VRPFAASFCVSGPWRRRGRVRKTRFAVDEFINLNFTIAFVCTTQGGNDRIDTIQDFRKVLIVAKLDSSMTDVLASGNPSGSPEIDGLLSKTAWGVAELEYSFPTTSDYSVYLLPPPGFSASDLHAFSNSQKEAAYFAVDSDMGPVASGAFSVEGLTNLELVLDTTPDVGTPGNASILEVEEIRFVGDLRSGGNIGYAYRPNNDPTNYHRKSGDVFVRTKSDGEFIENITDISQGEQLSPGGRAAYTVMHEFGHALGLKHPDDNDSYRGWGTLSPGLDNLTYTVMVAAPAISPGTVPAYPQTFMIGDIAALQYLYGANYSTNSDDTTYVWSPNSPNTVINGSVAIDSSANTAATNIFASIWDGGGNDTYDTSAYSSNQEIDLRPGESSVFDHNDLVTYDGTKTADGQIYNSFLFEGNPASLIENAIGGSGDDDVFGNIADNRLEGGSGDDYIQGLDGNDTLYGEDGDDVVVGGRGDDSVFGGAGADKLYGSDGADFVSAGSGNDSLIGSIGNDTMLGGDGDDTIKGEEDDDEIDGGAGNDSLYGEDGSDEILGGAGEDRLNGGEGSDTLIGGAGNDTISGENGDDWIEGGTGNDQLFGSFGTDTAPLGF
jgi:serralysin